MRREPNVEGRRGKERADELDNILLKEIMPRNIRYETRSDVILVMSWEKKAWDNEMKYFRNLTNEDQVIEENSIMGHSEFRTQLGTAIALKICIPFDMLYIIHQENAGILCFHGMGLRSQVASAEGTLPRQVAIVIKAFYAKINHQ